MLVRASSPGRSRYHGADNAQDQEAGQTKKPGASSVLEDLDKRKQKSARKEELQEVKKRVAHLQEVVTHQREELDRGMRDLASKEEELQEVKNAGAKLEED